MAGPARIELALLVSKTSVISISLRADKKIGLRRVLFNRLVVYFEFISVSNIETHLSSSSSGINLQSLSAPVIPNSLAVL